MREYLTINPNESIQNLGKKPYFVRAIVMNWILEEIKQLKEKEENPQTSHLKKNGSIILKKNPVLIRGREAKTEREMEIKK